MYHNNINTVRKYCKDVKQSNNIIYYSRIGLVLSAVAFIITTLTVY